MGLGLGLLMKLLRRRRKRGVCRPKKNDESKSWSEMLPELLESISDRLPLHDYFSFRGVCKSWRHAPSGRKEITSFDKKYPWLLLYGFDGNAPDKCYMYDFIKRSLCTFYFAHLRNTIVLESKSGWLLARRRDGDGHDDGQVFFLYNLFTLEKVDLPKHPKHKTYSEQVGSFVVPSTAATTPRDFFAVIVSRTGESSLEISVCRRAWAEDYLSWEVQSISLEDNDRFGSTRAVDCSDCNCRRWCICEMRGKKQRIYINGSKDGLVYDFVHKTLICWMRYVYPVSHRLNMVTKDWHRHWPIWQTRFGAEDISISVGAGSVSLESSHWDRLVAYTTTANEEEEELKMIKAAWVQPMFPKFCNSEEPML